MGWKWPCGPEEATRRMKARRYWLAKRRAEQAERRGRIFRHVISSGINPWEYGARERVARELGLSSKTVCKDMAALGWKRGRGQHPPPAELVERLKNEKPAILPVFEDGE